MGRKITYNTHQREDILAYFKERKGEHITALDVSRHFKEAGSSIGTTTVYRQLEKLVDEGLLNKYIIDMNSPACFEYVEASDHCAGTTCFHCKCEKCGKLIHMHCDELSCIAAHLKGEHGFMLDPMRTVFYGVCAECAGV
ncbi:MAG: transcriptional repressor [Lachnospiraceae bacterium]|nr:transcriptional repressor [Lachnospiraceae bacterium]